MADLSTTYLGLALSNPIVVSSSSLTGTLEGVRRCADAGAGAVVLKSVFEEQIEHEIALDEDEVSAFVHPEAQDYVRTMGKHLGPKDYLDLIEKARGAVQVPVIASLNCVSEKWWRVYAKQLQEAGASALELNLAIMPRTAGDSAEGVEARYLRIVDKVRREVTFPLSVKIGPYFTALPQFVDALRKAGASAVVLFNRFYQLDIDPTAVKLTPGYQFSTPAELHTTLRWISILAAQAGCDLSASTGVHDALGAAKILLAGATTVQVCSALYLKGVDHLRGIVSGLQDWMHEHGFAALKEVRGKLAQTGSAHPEAYERLQYIKALTGVH